MSGPGGAVLQGAGGRLLPASVPFGFFAAASIFHVAGWALLIPAHETLSRFVGGLGPELAALHMITLGVLTLTAFGAAFQLLPVATRRPIGAVWPIRLAWLALVPGIFVLGHGMGAYETTALAVGAVLTLFGLLIGGGVLAANATGSAGLPIVMPFVRFAVLGLFGLLALGALLVRDLAGFGPAPEIHDRIAGIHVVLGGFGFMGMLAMGLAYVLVPMFGLSPSPDARIAKGAFWLAVVAIIAAASAVVADSDIGVAFGALAGLGAVALHLYGMVQALRTRMRRRLGISFLLVRVAWVLMPVAIALGAGARLGIAGPNATTLFGFVLFYGWLLTFLLGILQRIMPFLASMHAAAAGRQPPLVSEMSASAPMAVHAGCHLAAVAAVAAGIALSEPLLIGGGAIVGTVGALAFLWFVVQVISRMVRRRRTGVSAGRMTMEKAYE